MATGNIFRHLRADEIDVRIGTIKQPKDGKQGGVSLLLYKDARCDQNILDETFGPFRWQKKYSRENANCTVSIRDTETNEWISKEDVGTASKTEAEKGLASDSFKRACVAWGIGRELYTSPFIFVSGDPEKLKFCKFKVKTIAYTEETREICKLIITDSYGNIVFDMKNPPAVEIYEPAVTPQNIVKAGAGTPPAQKAPEQAPQSPQNVQEGAPKAKGNVEIGTTDKVPEISPEMAYLQKKLEEFTADYQDDAKHTKFYQMRNVLVKDKKVSDRKLTVLTKAEIDALMKRIYQTFPPEAAS